MLTGHTVTWVLGIHEGDEFIIAEEQRTLLNKIAGEIWLTVEMLYVHLALTTICLTVMIQQMCHYHVEALL